MKTSTLLSLAGGSLLTISEIMPYISRIKSNGIIQFVFDSIFNKSSDNDSDSDDDEKQEKTFQVKQDCNYITLSFIEYNWKTSMLNWFRKQKVIKDKTLQLNYIDKKYDTIHIDLDPKSSKQKEKVPKTQPKNKKLDH